jgi:hypothetical protein
VTTDASTPRTSLFARLATALFAIAFFVAAWRYGWATAAPTIDESWAAVIGWAHLTGLRWGVDLVFTYGPLGYLSPNAPYIAGLHTTYLAQQAVLVSGYTFVFGYCFHRLGTVARIAFAVIVPFAVVLSADVPVLGAGIVAVVTLDDFVARTRGSRYAWIALALVALVTCATGLFKFSAFPPAVALAGVGAWLFARERRYAHAGIWLAVWFAALATLWIFVGGQSLGDLPAFVRTSIESAAGYGAAMGQEPPGATLAFGVATLVAALATIVVARRQRDSRALVVCAYLALCLCIAWRAAFTRADPWHTHYFFPLACLVAFALFALRTTRSTAFTAVASLCIAIAVAATAHTIYRESHLVTTAFARVPTTLPATQREKYERHAKMLVRRYNLPTIRNIVGDSRVDLYGCMQAYALINELSYAPRPVIQNYAAYTETLRRMNEAFFLGAQAPAYALLDSCVVDGRMPTADDGLALLAILRGYQPVVIEKNLLLMRKVPTAQPQPAPTPACPCTPLARDVWIDVPGDGAPMLMHVRYELSMAGSLRALFLSEPSLVLEVQFANGEPVRYRLPRLTARGGFLLSPLLVDAQTYLAWYFNRQRTPVARVRVVLESPSHDALFDPALEVGFMPVTLPDAAERGQTALGQ